MTEATGVPSAWLLVLSQIRKALSRMPRITPVSILEWYGMYQSVWVGFLYTAVDSWSSRCVTRTSRNASLPSASFSIVNSMLEDIWLRCAGRIAGSALRDATWWRYHLHTSARGSVGVGMSAWLAPLGLPWRGWRWLQIEAHGGIVNLFEVFASTLVKRHTVLKHWLNYQITTKFIQMQLLYTYCI